MTTTNSVVLTAVIVGVGVWAKGGQETLRIAIGAGALALFLSALNAANPKLASAFALLILVSAGFTYGPAIFKKVGLAG